MQKGFKVLFEDEHPLDYWCIRRFITSFPESYQTVVEEIIIKSQRLNKKIFGYNVAKLMPSFKMTRRGAFHGLRLDNEQNKPIDPKGVIKLCWRQVGVELQELKGYIKENALCERHWIPVDLPPGSRSYIIQNTNDLFEKLRNVKINGSMVGPVGASKVLFAALPEVALPVDNQEWKHVFGTDRYYVILSTMVDEIEEWEKRVQEKLNEASPYAKVTLPSIYNIMAMSARPLKRPKS
mgnify:CR=1 FL=1